MGVTHVFQCNVVNTMANVFISFKGCREYTEERELSLSGVFRECFWSWTPELSFKAWVGLDRWRTLIVAGGKTKWVNAWGSVLRNSERFGIKNEDLVIVTTRSNWRSGYVIKRFWLVTLSFCVSFGSLRFSFYKPDR